MIIMDIPVETLLKNREMIISEIKRYLGYSNQEPDEEINQMIISALEEIRDYSTPKYLIRAFPIHIDEKKQIIFIDTTKIIIKSKSLTQFLKGSQELVILAATLGLQVDQLIKRKSYSNLTQTLVFDATASAIVEEVCDFAEKKFRSELKSRTLELSQRFSPGYGDLGIELQPAILNLLNTANTLGIYTTDRFQLIPSKSITAFMGIRSATNEQEPNSDVKRNLLAECQKCYQHDRCYYIKKGETCDF